MGYHLYYVICHFQFVQSIKTIYIYFGEIYFVSIHAQMITYNNILTVTNKEQKEHNPYQKCISSFMVIHFDVY